MKVYHYPKFYMTWKVLHVLQIPLDNIFYEQRAEHEKMAMSVSYRRNGYNGSDSRPIQRVDISGSTFYHSLTFYLTWNVLNVPQLGLPLDKTFFEQR